MAALAADRVVHRLLPFVFAPLLMGQSCGLDVDKERGEPCTRDEECITGLECLGGVCDSPVRDGGQDDDAS